MSTLKELLKKKQLRINLKLQLKILETNLTSDKNEKNTVVAKKN